MALRIQEDRSEAVSQPLLAVTGVTLTYGTEDVSTVPGQALQGCDHPGDGGGGVVWPGLTCSGCGKAGTAGTLASSGRHISLQTGSSLNSLTRTISPSGRSTRYSANSLKVGEVSYLESVAGIFLNSQF